MSVSVFKNGDALYIVIFRDPNAKTLLQKWLTANRHAQAKVEDNKLHIYDNNTFNLFCITWKNDWNNILIWDTYLKRHIYI
jgi:hypothetical protein